MSSRIKYLVVSSSLLLTVLLAVGSVVGKSASPEDAYKHIGVFTDVISRIKSEYVEEPDMKSVALGAVNGLLESVDPFASYLNAEQYKEYLKSKDSRKADLGLVLSKKFGYVVVVGAVPGSPAAKAGISTNDILESIKGVATRDMPLAYAYLLLQGDPESSVELTVLRVRRPEPTKIKLSRAHITYPPVEDRLIEQQVGYVRPLTLAPGKTGEVAAAIRKLERQGAKKLILDLRGCSVGAPEEGIALANLFMDKGKIAHLKGQRVAQQDFNADPAKTVTRLPLVVITNRGTAGGAEVAAAALLDSKRAPVVGEATFGDAALRRAITMEDGGAIILSVAKYYSPSGKPIQDKGVTPSTPVAEPESQAEYDENGELLPETPEPQQPASKPDPLLKKALELSGVKTEA